MDIINHEYPYSLYHELNLDWILAKFKEWDTDWHDKQILIDDIRETATEAKERAIEAHALASAVSGVAHSALDTATRAEDTAGTAYTLAAGVRAVADEALETANDAKAQITTAVTKADDAYALAESVSGTASSAVTIAESALDMAEAAEEVANTAGTAAANAQNSANAAGTAAANANSRLDNISDYIVEQGIDGKWSYRKWNSGKQEAWYKEDTEFVTGAKNAFGSLYYKTKPAMNAWGAWYEKPVLLWSVHPTGGGLVGATLKSDTLSSSGVYSFDLFCWSSRDVSESLLIDFYVSGRWK